MTAKKTRTPGGLSPPQRIREFTSSNHAVFCAVYAAAELGVADQLYDGPLTTAKLARRLGVHEPSLYRLLRALTIPGLVVESAGRRFALTPLGVTLRTGPESMRPWVLFSGAPFRLAAWQEIVYSVRTGKTAFEKIFGLPLFEYLGKHPEAAAVFNAAMTSVTAQVDEAIANAYDFSRIRTLVDVGGGHGRLLATILKRNPALQGMLFELPHAAEGARGDLASAGLQARVEVVSGDFFKSVPHGGDAYLMKSIIHDWDDERCIGILRNCRRAMRPDGRVLVVEGVVPPPNEPSYYKLLDLEMLVLPGGLERTAEEFRTLFKRAGFQLTNIIATRAPQSIIEGVPA